MELEEAIEILNNYLCETHRKFCSIGAVGIPNKEYFAVETLLNHVTKQEKMLQKIHDNFCKFDWKNSNGEQVHNQLKELYESIFKNEESE